ncbi:MAG TPA: adenylate/guanylate cyclase domain-containing protein [Pyrinomonadaceae bacterium]|jgi:adenylate cyclase
MDEHGTFDKQGMESKATLDSSAGVPTIDASQPAFASPETQNTDILSRLALFYELPLKFAEVERIDNLMQLIVEGAIGLIPCARRGALLIKDRRMGKLILKAHVPVGNPAVSLTLAEQSMERRCAFIWPATAPAQPQPQQDDIFHPKRALPPSVVEYQIESAMYAPLLWKNETLGVLCVDNCEQGSSFSIDDLRLLQAVGHHAALAVANLQLQDDWRHQAEIQNNILKLIPPQIVERLKHQRGRIRLGGEFHEATILISDIRGFTNLSTTMSPDEVTEMLEDYFGRLVPLVFKYHGTIDKFVGDAILAVFGSPTTDDQQQLHGVMTAMEMQSAMREVNAQRASEGKRTGELGIGLHFGEVVHGFIGTPQRMEYTVIGDTVNRASRYCDGARGGEILISPDMYQWVWKFVEVEATSFDTKHEGRFAAYRVKRIK